MIYKDELNNSTMLAGSGGIVPQAATYIEPNAPAYFAPQAPQETFDIQYGTPPIIPNGGGLPPPPQQAPVINPLVAAGLAMFAESNRVDGDLGTAVHAGLNTYTGIKQNQVNAERAARRDQLAEYELLGRIQDRQNAEAAAIRKTKALDDLKRENPELGTLFDLDPDLAGKFALKRLGNQYFPEERRIIEQNGVQYYADTGQPVIANPVNAEPDKPQTPLAKLKADVEAGLVPQEVLDAKIAEETGAEAKEKQNAILEGQKAKAGVVITSVDEAINLVDKAGTSGFVGQIGKNIGGTNAYDLDKIVDTIKANLSFEELQTMRNNSPTGGALGSIALRELELLGATIASLEVGQSDEQLRKNLNKVKSHYQNWLDAVEKSDAGGDSTETPQAPASNEQQAVIDEGLLEFMDDNDRALFE